MVVIDSTVHDEAGKTFQLLDIRDAMMVKTDLRDNTVLVVDGNEPLLLLTCSSNEEATKKHKQLASEIHTIHEKYLLTKS